MITNDELNKFKIAGNLKATCDAIFKDFFSSPKKNWGCKLITIFKNIIQNALPEGAERHERNLIIPHVAVNYGISLCCCTTLTPVLVWFMGNAALKWLVLWHFHFQESLSALQSTHGIFFFILKVNTSIFCIEQKVEEKLSHWINNSFAFKSQSTFMKSEMTFKKAI